MHALKTGVPAGNDMVGSVGEGDGFLARMIEGGVEFRAIRKPTGVANGVILAGFGERAGSDGGVDVAEGVERLGGADDLGDAGWVVGGVCGLGRCCGRGGVVGYRFFGGRWGC